MTEVIVTSILWAWCCTNIGSITLTIFFFSKRQNNLTSFLESDSAELARGRSLAVLVGDVWALWLCPLVGLPAGLGTLWLLGGMRDPTRPGRIGWINSLDPGLVSHLKKNIYNIYNFLIHFLLMGGAENESTLVQVMIWYHHLTQCWQKTMASLDLNGHESYSLFQANNSNLSHSFAIQDWEVTKSKDKSILFNL